MSGPDLTRKVIGYRAWSLGDDLVLRSHGYGGSDWKIGVNEARCRAVQIATMRGFKPEGSPAPHAAPEKDCECGLYAWHSAAILNNFQANQHRAYGFVTAWGRMQVHRDGFRAEFAQPIALAWSETSTVGQKQRIEECGRKHGLKVMPLAELEEFAASYGQAVPESLMPTKTAWPGFEITQSVHGHGGYFVPPTYLGSAYAPGIAFAPYLTRRHRLWRWCKRNPVWGSYFVYLPSYTTLVFGGLRLEATALAFAYSGTLICAAIRHLWKRRRARLLEEER